MSNSRPTRVLLLGASLDTNNMGVSVLAAGAVKCVLSAFPDAELSFFDYAKTPSTQTIRLEGRTVALPKINIRFSKKFYLPNNIALLLLLAILLRCIPIKGFRSWVLGRNSWLRHMAEADLVLSIAGGDSFSDIYGMRRLLYVSLPQVLALLMERKLVLMPQTIGPFKASSAKRLARFILKRAARVYGRDHASVDLARELSRDTSAKCSFSYDMGFVVDAIPPADATETGLHVRAARTRPVVGLNVSGLLFGGGYTRDNMFGLCVDYPALIRNVIDFLVTRKNAQVLLVPHVFASIESDSQACEQILASLKPSYGEMLTMASGKYDQSELKYIIGQCDFFIGARMHACIAALSQGVPAVSIAYSDKFIGVMKQIGVESSVADARSLDEAAIVAVVDDCFQRRKEIRSLLLETMQHVKTSVIGLLADNTAPSSAASPSTSRDSMHGYARG